MSSGPKWRKFAICIDGLTLNGDPIPRLVDWADDFDASTQVARLACEIHGRAWVESWHGREQAAYVIVGWRRNAKGDSVRDQNAGPTAEQLGDFRDDADAA